MPRINYDQLAKKYDQRYCENSLAGVERALVHLARDHNAKMILEVGCGTGRWLNSLANSIQSAQLFGLDYSLGMLAQAQEQPAPLLLVQGKGGQLPLVADPFDLIFCVNAIHHFDNPQNFILQARQVLRPGGILAIVGQVPHDQQNRWYVYDYFDGIFETDLSRFPTWVNVLDWMFKAGFRNIHLEPVEWIVDDKHGWEVLDDPFLQKHAVSQLAMLSDEQYAAGIERIKRAIRIAESSGYILEFITRLRLDLIIARSL